MQYVQKVFQGNKDLHIEDRDFQLPDSFQSIYSNNLSYVSVLYKFVFCFLYKFEQN